MSNPEFNIIEAAERFDARRPLMRKLGDKTLELYDRSMIWLGSLGSPYRSESASFIMGRRRAIAGLALTGSIIGGGIAIDAALASNKQTDQIQACLNAKYPGVIVEYEGDLSDPNDPATVGEYRATEANGKNPTWEAAVANGEALKDCSGN